MHRGCLLIAAALLSAAVPLAAGPLQQDYDAAQAAFDAGQMQAARDGFAALLPRLPHKTPPTLAVATVMARLGHAELALGNVDLAAPLLSAALAGLKPGDAEYLEALHDLAAAQETGLDYAAAAATYRRAIAAATGVEQFNAQVGLARMLLFGDPAAARAILDGIVDSPLSVAAKPELRAQLKALRGRVELNDGNAAAAQKLFREALALAGGLTTRSSVADIRIRGDLALVSKLSGDDDAARRYFAFTGAGGLPELGFSFGADMPLPTCAVGGAPDRDDVGIVEFGIADDGRVFEATPIYVRRAGPSTPAQREAVALAFARAVRNWSWTPAAAQKLPAFWRQGVRIEVRCVDGQQQPDIVWKSFQPLLQQWLANYPTSKPGDPMPDTSTTAAPMVISDAAALPKQKARLERMTAAFGDSAPQLVPELLGLSNNAVVGRDAARGYLERAAAIMAETSAPADSRTMVAVMRAIVRRNVEDQRASTAMTRQAIDELRALAPASGLPAATRGDALALLMLARMQTWLRDAGAATVSLRGVVAAPASALPEADPIRLSATLELATIEAAASRVDAAHALVAATGLSPEQCALVDVEPLQIRSARTAYAFPPEALGFDGFVSVAYDIDAEGKPVGMRTVLAVPPLLFSPATEKIVGTQRFRPIFRGGAAIGCHNRVVTTRFVNQR